MMSFVYLNADSSKVGIYFVQRPLTKLREINKACFVLSVYILFFHICQKLKLCTYKYGSSSVFIECQYCKGVREHHFQLNKLFFTYSPFLLFLCIRGNTLNPFYCCRYPFCNFFIFIPFVSP